MLEQAQQCLIQVPQSPSLQLTSFVPWHLTSLDDEINQIEFSETEERHPLLAVTENGVLLEYESYEAAKIFFLEIQNKRKRKF